MPRLVQIETWFIKYGLQPKALIPKLTDEDKGNLCLSLLDEG